MPDTTASRYDIAEHLRTQEEMAVYLDACLEEAAGDAAFIAKPLGDIVRARGMSQVASDAGLSRESLYRALSGERNPTLDTVQGSRRPGPEVARRSGFRLGRGHAGRTAASLNPCVVVSPRPTGKRTGRGTPTFGSVSPADGGGRARH